MFLIHLTSAVGKLRAFKAPIVVVAISALLALLFTIATQPNARTVPQTAGEAKIRLVQDEHALVADYVHGKLAADQAATARDRAEMHSFVTAETTDRTVTVVTPVPKRPKAMQTALRAAILPPPKPAPAVGPPMPLQATAAPPPRRGPVVERARAVLATVERIPHWVRVGVQDAADWAIVGPVQMISRLPERRFL